MGHGALYGTADWFFSFSSLAQCPSGIDRGGEGRRRGRSARNITGAAVTADAAIAGNISDFKTTG